jgi:hypothetical protein
MMPRIDAGILCREGYASPVRVSSAPGLRLRRQFETIAVILSWPAASLFGVKSTAPTAQAYEMSGLGQM